MSIPTVAAVGIDVSAAVVHIVGLDSDGAIRLCRSFTTADIELALIELTPNTPVGIDGPLAPSKAPFIDDTTIAPKFRTARGCEVELGRQHRLWVSYPTPTDRAAFAPWMATAADLSNTVTLHGHMPLETWPYATFHTLAEQRPPKKTTPEGKTVRRALLHESGITDPDGLLTNVGHDLIDATAAALVAWQYRHGEAVPVRCERDNTCLWLARRTQRPV